MSIEPQSNAWIGVARPLETVGIGTPRLSNWLACVCRIECRPMPGSLNLLINQDQAAEAPVEEEKIDAVPRLAEA
jgi:hypothetical protein